MQGGCADTFEVHGVMIRGIFWLIDDELLCFKDETFNHQRTWATLPGRITGGVPYNHYPRGRVVIKTDKAVIYLNPHICTESVVDSIKREFGLTDAVVDIQIDGSKHYKCHLDN